MDNIHFIKLETNSQDNYGPIYVYINVKSIVSLSRFRAITNITLVNGEHFTVKESVDEIRSMIRELEK